MSSITSSSGTSVLPYVPYRFSLEIALHLLRNLTREPSPGTPLLLGIHGPTGEGKTYQTEHVLERANVQTVLVSGGQLESVDAGNPAEVIRSAYIEAATTVDNKQPAAVLLNDADAAIGHWSAMTQYTVNTQIVITELMHLADYPTRVDRQHVRRVPIILTGNDFTRLYLPLCRPGRMELFRWELTNDERIAILTEIFPYLGERELRQLVVENPQRSVAFWTGVRLRLEKGEMLARLEGASLRNVLQAAVHGEDEPFVTAVANGNLDAVRAAVAEVTAHEASSHLSAFDHYREEA